MVKLGQYQQRDISQPFGVSSQGDPAAPSTSKIPPMRPARPPKPTSLAIRPAETPPSVAFPSKILPEEENNTPGLTVTGQGRVSLNVTSPSKPKTPPSGDPGVPPKMTSSFNMRSPLQGSNTPPKPPYPVYGNKFGWAEHVYGSPTRRHPDSSHSDYPLPYPHYGRGSDSSSRSPVTTPHQPGQSHSASSSSTPPVLPHPVPIGFERLYSNNPQPKHSHHKAISPEEEHSRHPPSVPMSPASSHRSAGNNSPAPSFGNLSVSAVSKKRDNPQPSSSKRYSADFNDQILADPEYPEVYGMGMARRAFGGSLNTGGIGIGPSSLEQEDQRTAAGYERISSAPPASMPSLFLSHFYYMIELDDIFNRLHTFIILS